MVNNTIDMHIPYNGNISCDMLISLDNTPKENGNDFTQIGNRNFCLMSIETSISSESKSSHIDMHESESLNNFQLNNQMWNYEKRFDSFNNYDSGYFDEIVKMGKDAVPYILSEIEKKPSPIVHALDLIFPGKVKYNGFVPLKVACEVCISILRKTGTV